MTREIKFRAWDGSDKYVAGSDGLIYSTDFNHTGKTKALKGVKDKDGYPHVLMNIDGKIGSSLSAATQRDTPEQKEIICQLIDLCDGKIFLDWDGKYVSKKAAKKYVMEY